MMSLYLAHIFQAKNHKTCVVYGATASLLVKYAIYWKWHHETENWKLELQGHVLTELPIEVQYIFHVCIICVIIHVWTYTNKGNAETSLQFKHRKRVAFVWCHYKSLFWKSSTEKQNNFNISSECIFGVF